MSYVCWDSRRCVYISKEDISDDEVDSQGKKEDIYINIFKNVEKKENGHFLLKYTNQTSQGQSGGPVILYKNDEMNGIIGIIPGARWRA